MLFGLVFYFSELLDHLVPTNHKYSTLLTSWVTHKHPLYCTCWSSYTSFVMCIKSDCRNSISKASIGLKQISNSSKLLYEVNNFTNGIPLAGHSYYARRDVRRHRISTLVYFLSIGDITCVIFVTQWFNQSYQALLRQWILYLGQGLVHGFWRHGYFRVILS